MMLGTMQLVHSRYDKQPELLGELSPELLTKAIGKLPSAVYIPRVDSVEAAPVPLLPNAAFQGVKNGAYTIVDNVLGIYEDNQFTQLTLTPKAEARVRGMMKLRDAVREVFRTQLDDAGDEAIVEARQILNYVYDRYRRDYGCLSSRENSRAFADDPDAPLILSLEQNYDEQTSRADKAAIFERRTLERYEPVQSVETAPEALAVSLNEYGRIEWGRMMVTTAIGLNELPGHTAPKPLRRPLLLRAPRHRIPEMSASVWIQHIQILSRCSASAMLQLSK